MSRHRGVVVAVVVSAGIALLLGIDVSHRGWISRGDPGRLRFFVDHRSHLLGPARVITAFGSFGVLVAVGVIAALGLRTRGVRWWTATAPLVAATLTGELVYLIKRGVDRPRPPVSVRLASVNDPSFPSGHAADSTALFLTLALVVGATLLSSRRHRRLANGATVAWCGLIGISRLVLGVHWSTDVVAGWSIGLAMSLLVAGLLVRTGPADSPGGSDYPATG